jgi:hypothetical protein
LLKLNLRLVALPFAPEAKSKVPPGIKHSWPLVNAEERAKNRPNLLAREVWRK